MFNIVPLAGVVEELDADIVRMDTGTPDATSKRRPARVQTARAAGE